MAEDPKLEEYWEALRGTEPKVPEKKRRSKLEIQMTPERAGMVSQEERDRAIIARSDHLRASNYYRRQPDQEEGPSEEELRQAVLDRAPHLAEWVIRARSERRGPPPAVLSWEEALTEMRRGAEVAKEEWGHSRGICISPGADRIRWADSQDGWSPGYSDFHSFWRIVTPGESNR